ncbi:amidase [Dactylosporangium sp. CA-092794]|uniref:amidase n=1 Tax=Dactylosporangium sp. CA-092794 TaxID=3239929 RepID=UPI003D8CDBE8
MSTDRAPGLPYSAPALTEHGGAYAYLVARPPAAGHGALAGVRLAVKDLISIRGYPMRAGSKARQSAVPETTTAPVVARLLERGASLIGATTLHEFAFGVTGVNDHAGTPANPRDPRCIPGGSSSGSAVAVAEGSADLAVGTDTGGSVRIPAALCGVVGFKPAYGSYPVDGVYPLAPSLDHVGLLARTVSVVVRAHTALTGQRPSPADRLRIGLLRAELDDADPLVSESVALVADVLARSGHTVCELPWLDPQDVFEASTTLLLAEAARVHRAAIVGGALDRYGADVRERLLRGAAVDAVAETAARRVQDRLCRLARERFGAVDCVIGPTVPVLAPRLDDAWQATIAARLVRNTRAANLVGLPAVTLPLPGPGLPIGLQICAASNVAVLGAAQRIAPLLAAADPSVARRSGGTR